MKLYILISKRVEASFQLPSQHQGAPTVCIDPIAETLKLLRDRGEEDLGILYCIDAEHLDALNEILKEQTGERFRYVITVFAGSRQIHLEPSAMPHVISYRSGLMSEAESSFVIDRAAFLLRGKEQEEREQTRQYATLEDAWRDQESLIRIGKSLSLERDPDVLLRTILYLSKKITGADAGSIFLVEEAPGGNRLRFKQSHTFSLDLDYSEFTLPLDTNSIAGYVAVTGEVLNLEDVYRLPADSPVTFNPEFDKRTGYRTKSMLVVPMRGNLDRIIGVIQLINSKENNDSLEGMEEAFSVLLRSRDDFENLVFSFHHRYESLMEAVAGQAAIALENSRMLQQIERQFEAFVKASVKAIESRDPATSGHSFRVAAMCLAVAKAINQDKGRFAETSFDATALKELEFAALLHDFGKVYIEPDLFLKAKKLFDKDYINLSLRLKLLYRSFPEDRRRMEGLREIMAMVKQLNEPTVTDVDPAGEIERICSMVDTFQCVDPDGELIPLLTEQEAENLSIRRGSLNAVERKVIESHVERTHDFVEMIPWPVEYRRIPEIARDHHEKLDGTGYPRGISGDAIALESRIMAIADIFDALSASDRPYKRAVPLEKVLAILREEADSGKVDSDIVDIWIEHEVWREEKWDSSPW
jgi:HD-GYP domain-containing protein (c-di-GMP phosphodiesterase class II)